MQFRFTGAPLELGCGTTGTSGAWAALRGPLAAAAAQLGVPAAFAETPADNTLVSPPEDGLKNAEAVLAVCRALAREVTAAHTAGEFPVMIGGDHSIGLGSISGISSAIPPEQLSVIWVDAHTDINTEKTSVSHNIHGMPLAAALGLCGPRLASVCARPRMLLPENLYIIGAHSIDPPELDICREQGVRLYTMERVRALGLERTLAEVVSSVKTAAIHLSFDVDALDSDRFAATGLPLSGGYTPEEAARLLEGLIAALPVVSFDCVEYNPARDPDGKDLETVMTILRRVLAALVRKDRGDN